MSTQVVIVEGLRTPQGVFGGALKSFTAQRLGELVIRELLTRTRVRPDTIEEVVFGCVGQTSDAPNVARVIALLAGLPNRVPAYTVQRNCASGLQAVINAYQNILCGERDVQIAGGTECMSAAPYVNRDLRWGKRLRHSELIDTIWEGLTDPVCGQIMGRTAENLVEEFGLTRQDQDRFALLSHQRAFRATREGRFKDELTTVLVPKKAYGKDLPPEPFVQDEGVNPALNEQMLSQYPPIFKEGGTVTSGNSCFNADGAAAVLVMSAQKAKELGLAALATLRAYAVVGLEPHRMGLGPALAIPEALQKARVSLKDIGLIEINEAFAATYLVCEKTLNLNREIVNVNGGAIALGHPVGQSGTRIVITLLHEMKRRGVPLGLATLCVGGGQGVAMVFERA
ncbi:MAG: acetyl-CoA acetyltransferase [Omnitrophica WOR_2 bacterium RIFCSPLOWO2_02_FULL_63_16]|nr:MAG: acetyl-CoA acetyltransferase [Omnitrophica WOR_2 bacterium GWA2_63_20]OGX17418.1 MAG: acetyl-CoA acetyltransferase [Omnitrophica WOR_2 bacterium GWF2_63_9]OGX32072.1 MAG: acetyl-CoA acetyltransferase [Omnitrophica WOR_2 bacterium RIFCSPHIGHO2_12_FULL_64_13]OGX35260.1 MAG: acetyl-CoA acetyltransferase [Omnitrophica WOR_2 bacterium RIFCSPHIGHO2_02_FULL_63_39]OGX45103.1 MAG: acetyl-CoA acetyltransferase [Omnitrophica WOR_2 bacterium RIFCSPLOWO2_02_FULL_63_16]OGX48988.1 MAG: acetyl-CoA ace